MGDVDPSCGDDYCVGLQRVICSHLTRTLKAARPLAGPRARRHQAAVRDSGIPEDGLWRCDVTYETRTGGVLFAASVDRVAAFYSSVLGLGETARADDHVLLESPAFQLVVHRIPGHAARDTDVAGPPARRAQAAFKPVFFVHDLATVRSRARAHGGELEPVETEWSFGGSRVCDGVDPEGNVIQFREMAQP